MFDDRMLNMCIHSPVLGQKQHMFFWMTSSMGVKNTIPTVAGLIMSQHHLRGMRHIFVPCPDCDFKKNQLVG